MTNGLSEAVLEKGHALAEAVRAQGHGQAPEWYEERSDSHPFFPCPLCEALASFLGALNALSVTS